MSVALLGTVLRELSTTGDSYSILVPVIVTAHKRANGTEDTGPT